MIPRLAAGAVTAAVAVALAGCSASAPRPGAVPAPETTAAEPPAAPAGVLPPPEALTEVIYRLADPVVPGTEKLPLVEGATAADAETLDRFAAALRDGGFDPVRIGASDIRWAETRPADVVATIEVAPGGAAAAEAAPADGDDAAGFRFPMEFRPEGGGWQLTRETAEMVLAFPAPGPTP